MRVISRYLVREFFAVLLPTLAGLVSLYLLVDFLDRLDILLENDATLSASLRYFLFKIPLIVTQILPPAVLVAALISVGLMARNHEIIALRAAGISLWQSSTPLLAIGLLLSAAALLWNETAVPYFTHAFQDVNRIEIRKRGQRALLSERGVWYRGGAGFYNIDHFDSHAEVLYGLTIFRVDGDFQIDNIIEIPSARWIDGSWVFENGWSFSARAAAPSGRTMVEGASFALPETLADFKEVHLEAEELSYVDLHRRITRLSSRGIDTSHYAVELNLKLAVPFAILALVWGGIPIAARVRRNPNLATTFAGGLVLGFGYWVLLGFTRSLGETQVLGPVLAAWAPNLIAALAGTALYLGSE
ncbi:MAG TPA: LPS export ABC transporter permease LptG [Terriglobales bacterium]|nr:LPS export ABC transporter permease LptG [Terriglobales bacterium]